MTNQRQQRTEALIQSILSACQRLSDKDIIGPEIRMLSDADDLLWQLVDAIEADEEPEPEQSEPPTEPQDDICVHCGEKIAPRFSDGIRKSYWHVTLDGEPCEPYNYGKGGGGRYGMHLAARQPRPEELRRG